MNTVAAILILLSPKGGAEHVATFPTMAECEITIEATAAANSDRVRPDYIRGHFICVPIQRKVG